MKSTEPQTFTVRAGSGGEAVVIWPDGRMQFMGLWAFICFAFRAGWAGHKVEVQHD
jgi:hypothetical protein